MKKRLKREKKIVLVFKDKDGGYMTPRAKAVRAVMWALEKSTEISHIRVFSKMLEALDPDKEPSATIPEANYMGV
jgi:hypothetical protein